MTGLKLHHEQRGRVDLVSLSGELDTFAADKVGRIVDAPTARDLIVALDDVSFVDSAGLHALFRLGTGARDEGRHLVFVVSETCPIRHVLELVQLGEITPVCASVELALERLDAD